MKKYYLYLLLCKNGSIYCGITDNVKRRFQDHKAGKGARYTRSFPPVKILYTKKLPNRSTALKKEYEIKKLSHKQKIELIRKPSKKLLG